jgi:hypothetical protein
VRATCDAQRRTCTARGQRELGWHAATLLRQGAQGGGTRWIRLAQEVQRRLRAGIGRARASCGRTGPFVRLWALL